MSDDDDVRQKLKQGKPVLDILNEELLDKVDALEILTVVSEYHERKVELECIVRFLTSHFEEELKTKVKKFTLRHFKEQCLDGGHFRQVEALSPLPIALVEVDRFFNDERFEHFDVTEIEGYEDLDIPHEIKMQDHMAMRLGVEAPKVPTSAEYWVYDRKYEQHLVISYEIAMGGVCRLMIESGGTHGFVVIEEVREAIETSKYIRGQVLEVGGGALRITDKFRNERPVMPNSLIGELEKNVINVFKKSDKFKEYSLPSKRSLAFAGNPGNGKTMICRWLANRLKGDVTVFWASSKAIHTPDDIEYVFRTARKMSPALLVLEDIDLMVGSRTHDPETLGEMLQQLEGLNKNDELVVIATTNRINALDEALRREGRIDRIYDIGNPDGEQAVQIAKDFLLKHNVTPKVVEELSFPSIAGANLTGAQIVGIMEGAIFEAIYRECPINDLCISASYKNLMEQRDKFSVKN
jgi:hypothetical protein